MVSDPRAIVRTSLADHLRTSVGRHQISSRKTPGNVNIISHAWPVISQHPGLSFITDAGESRCALTEHIHRITPFASRSGVTPEGANGPWYVEPRTLCSLPLSCASPLFLLSLRPAIGCVAV